MCTFVQHQEQISIQIYGIIIYEIKIKDKGTEKDRLPPTRVFS